MTIYANAENRGIIKPVREVYIVASEAVVGHEEHGGPLGKSFRVWDNKDDSFGMDSWE